MRRFNRRRSHTRQNILSRTRINDIRITSIYRTFPVHKTLSCICICIFWRRTRLTINANKWTCWWITCTAICIINNINTNTCSCPTIICWDTWIIHQSRCICIHTTDLSRFRRRPNIVYILTTNFCRSASQRRTTIKHILKTVRPKRTRQASK